MKDNCLTIKNNVLPGDILLFRAKDSLLTVRRNGKITTNWDEAVFSIGNGLILREPARKWRIVKLSLSCLVDGTFDIGLFRTMPEFTEIEIEKLMTESKWIMDRYYRDLNFMVTPITLMATAYERVGLKFTELPPWKMEPADFDESPITVRIA